MPRLVPLTNRSRMSPPPRPARLPRLMVARPGPVASLVAAPRQVLAGARLYQRTPSRLRRPEPAMRLAVAGVVGWFSLFFVALAVLVARVAPAAAPIRGGAWLSAGYLVAAVLGPIGLGLFVTRHHRPGLILVASMFVAAQAVTLVAVV